MRWERLFYDLAAQADALERAERDAEIRERTRIESGTLRMADRLAAAVGTDVRLECIGELTVHGRLTRWAPTWLLVAEGAGRETLVAVSAVQVVAGIGRLAAPPGSAGRVTARLGLPSALRAIARDRLPVRLHLRDAQTVDGTIDRVGADFVEVATHPVAELRRGDLVYRGLVMAIDALAAVRRTGLG